MVLGVAGKRGQSGLAQLCCEKIKRTKISFFNIIILDSVYLVAMIIILSSKSALSQLPAFLVFRNHSSVVVVYYYSFCLQFKVTGVTVHAWLTNWIYEGLGFMGCLDWPSFCTRLHMLFWCLYKLRAQHTSGSGAGSGYHNGSCIVWIKKYIATSCTA